MRPARWSPAFARVTPFGANDAKPLLQHQRALLGHWLSAIAATRRSSAWLAPPTDCFAMP